MPVIESWARLDMTQCQDEFRIPSGRTQKLKAAKWCWKQQNEHNLMYIYHKQCENMQKIQWKCSNGQIQCFYKGTSGALCWKPKKTRKTRETKTRIAQNFLIVWPIPGCTMSKSMPRAFQICMTHGGKDDLYHSFWPPKSRQMSTKNFRAWLRYKKLTLLNWASVCFETNRISCLPFVDIWRDFGGQKLWYKSSLPPCVIHILKALGMLFDMVEPWMGHSIGKNWVFHVLVSLVFLVFWVFSTELLT